MSLTMPAQPSPAEYALLLILGLLAGYAVNLAADLAPEHRPLRSGWRAPLYQLPSAWLSRLHLDAETSGLPRRASRHAAVYAAACLLAILSQRSFGWSWQALMIALYAWFFLAVAAIDLEHRVVLNRMLMPAAATCLAMSLAMGLPYLTAALLGAAAGFFTFMLFRLAYPRGMGMGDVKLAGMIGLATGFPGVITALLVGILAGGVAALALIIVHHGRRGQTMAYAPYLVLGAWASMLAGPALLISTRAR